MPSRLAFRPDLQGLRAVAVSLVVLAHAEVSWFAGGFVGVDVFFVLSGYLITALLVREYDRQGRISFLDFYARRVRRLFPALLLMIVVAGILGVWLLTDFEANQQLASSPFAAVWASNFYFAFAGLDYFNDLTQNDLFLHTWSLGVEEQFYLIWPMILLFVLGCFGRKARTGLFLPILLLSSIGLTSFVLSLYLTFHEPRSAFFLMPSRIWQFSLGGLVSLAFHASQKERRPLAKASVGGISDQLLLAGGMTLILGSAVLLHPGVPYPGFWGGVPSLGAVMVIVAGQRLSQGLHSVLAQPALVWLGDRSYSIYLWHWPILILGFSLGFEGQPVPTAGLVLLSVVLAMLSYRFVELPFWKGRLSSGSNRIVLLVGLTASLLTGACTFLALRWLPDQAPQYELSAQWRTYAPPLYAMGCDAWFSHAKVEPCEFGNPQAEKTLLIIGDSIGVQWFSMLKTIFDEPEWQTIVATKSACALVDEEFFYERLGKVYEVCEQWRNDLLDNLDFFGADLIVVGSAATYNFTVEQWTTGSSRVFGRLSEVAEQVVVIPGTPSLGFDGPSCLIRQMNRKVESDVLVQNCSAPDQLRLVSDVTEHLDSAAQQFQNVHFLDMNDLVCPNGICAAGDPDGIVVFRDDQHLTDTFVQSLAPEALARLRRLGILP